jgi:hypothetical protein
MKKIDQVCTIENIEIAQRHIKKAVDYLNYHNRFPNVILIGLYAFSKTLETLEHTKKQIEKQRTED